MRRFSQVVLVVVLATLLAVPAGAVVATDAGGGTHATAATQEECSFPVTETDATGAEVTVDADPERVVVLQASAAQTMWELNASEEVVGMPIASYTTYLEGAENRTNVLTEDGAVNVEQVVALEPDLVLAPNVVPNETVNQLRRNDITVFKLSFGRSLEGIYAKTRLVGRLTGNCAAADRVVTDMQNEVREIGEIAAGPPTPKVLFYMPSNYTAGEGTFIHRAIELAGGENVAATAGVSGYAPINEEWVVQHDPEVIVVQEGFPLPNTEVFQSTYAVEHDQVVTVDRNYISQPAPRVVRPMRTMAETFAAASVRTPTATAAETATTTPDTPDTTATTAGDGPGFGVIAALVAALAAALVASRRQ